ncbi:MAG: PQQ-binding-like beta-propeller repeat protein [Bauldia sp.]
MSKQSLLGGAALVAVGVALGGTAWAQDKTLTTTEQLLKPDPNNWLHVHRTYDSHRYSPLDQINKDTVKNLGLAFVTPLGVPSAGGRYTNAQNEGTPLVENGFMYIVSGWSVVTKVDVRDGKWGKILWRYTPEMDRKYISDTACCGAESRGIGLWQNEVVSVSLDGQMVALNKDSGEVIWSQKIANKDRAETFTIPPLVVKDTAIVGPAGGEYGIRGWLEARDLKTGQAKWHTWTIPGPGEPGNETWAGEDWKTGGGSTWQAGSYDPEQNLIYYGTGNPAPQFDAEYRPGDNLYTDSLIALDVDTGKLKWYFQFTPNDPFDYDEIGDNQLYDMVINGQPRKVVARFARNGIAYAMDRANGSFIWGQQYVDTLKWTNGVDPKTGKPTSYDPNLKLQTYNGTVGRRGGPASLVCPGLAGGKNWEPASFSDRSKLYYTGARNACGNTNTAEAVARPTVTGGTFLLTDPAGWRGRGTAPADRRPPIPSTAVATPSVVAVDPATGATVKKILVPILPYGVLSTAGGLVFTADRGGQLTAYDDQTLAQIWQGNAGTAIYGPPISYAVNGKQYIAVLVGGAGAGGAGVDPAVSFFVPTDALYVFTLQR